MLNRLGGQLNCEGSGIPGVAVNDKPRRSFAIQENEPTFFGGLLCDRILLAPEPLWSSEWDRDILGNPHMLEHADVLVTPGVSGFEI